METVNHAQRTISQLATEYRLDIWIEAFLIDCRARNLSRGTLNFYKQKLTLFYKYCDLQAVSRVDQIDATILRKLLIHLVDTNHNEGGTHAVYRSIKAFLIWFEKEVEPKDWTNPIKKVKGPKISSEPLPPVSYETIKNLLKECNPNSFTGARDRALILSLLDTGARAGEAVAVNIEDLDLPKGQILIRSGKGRKPRLVFIGQKTRKAIRMYLQLRNDTDSALWVTISGHRIRYGGIREIILRRSADAGINPPNLHSFRRQFALSMLRSGVDVFSLQRLMGHADLQVLRRYLAQTDQDGKHAHDLGCPVEKLFSGID